MAAWHCLHLIFQVSAGVVVVVAASKRWSMRVEMVRMGMYEYAWHIINTTPPLISDRCLATKPRLRRPYLH